MLKHTLTFICDGCGEKKELVVNVAPGKSPGRPDVPQNWKEILGKQYCPVHEVKVEISDLKKGKTAA